MDLRDLIRPHAEQIARHAHIGVVFLVNKPGPIARAGLKVARAPRAKRVFALPSDLAAQRYGVCGRATRAWLKSPADPDTIKIFVIAGEGSALVTLDFHEPGTVGMTVEPPYADFEGADFN